MSWNSHKLVSIYAGCLARVSLGELLPEILRFIRGRLVSEIPVEDAIICLQAILVTPNKGLGFATVARVFSMVVYNKTHGTTNEMIDLIAEIDHKAGEVLTEILNGV